MTSSTRNQKPETRNAVQVLPEDLVNLIIEADNIRRTTLGVPHSHYSHARRIWIEPPFNVLGKVFGHLQRALPWTWRKAFDRWIIWKMGGHAFEENPQLPAVIAQTVALAKDLQRVSGQWPAAMVLTSHPETEGPLHWLRFELIRQSQFVTDALTEASGIGTIYKPHAQCFLAIDPFALDTVSVSSGAFYAAWMHTLYFAWDRQPSTQSWIQRRWLLRDSGYRHMAWRLLRRLRSNIPVIMVMSGGLPPNARLLYTAREFIQRLKIPHWPYPKRAAEKKLMKILMQPVKDVLPAAKGEIPEETAGAVQDLLQELGLKSPENAAAVESFKEEWKLAVPYRARLLNILINRLVRKGKPLLLLATSHTSTTPHVHMGTAWGLFVDAQGVVQLAKGSLANAAPLDSSRFPREFSRQFR